MPLLVALGMRLRLRKHCGPVPLSRRRCIRAGIQRRRPSRPGRWAGVRRRPNFTYGGLSIHWDPETCSFSLSSRCETVRIVRSCRGRTLTTDGKPRSGRRLSVTNPDTLIALGAAMVRSARRTVHFREGPWLVASLDFQSATRRIDLGTLRRKIATLVGNGTVRSRGVADIQAKGDTYSLAVATSR